MSEPTNHCDECGLDYFYAPKYHECAHKGRPQTDFRTWVEECMDKQYDR